jgi:hypothetical protein
MQKGKVARMAAVIGLAMGLAVGMTAVGAAGQAFKVYPGAKKYTPDTKETQDAAKSLPPGTEATIYLTDDSFEKVAAFYKGMGKEYAMPGMKKGKLPSGQEMEQAIFIFDGAADLMSSKNWVKVQRPYIGGLKMNGATPEYHDIRDVTAIVFVQKK